MICTSLKSTDPGLSFIKYRRPHLCLNTGTPSGYGRFGIYDRVSNMLTVKYGQTKWFTRFLQLLDNVHMLNYLCQRHALRNSLTFSESWSSSLFSMKSSPSTEYQRLRMPCAAYICHRNMDSGAYTKVRFNTLHNNIQNQSWWRKQSYYQKNLQKFNFKESNVNQREVVRGLLTWCCYWEACSLGLGSNSHWNKVLDSMTIHLPETQHL